MLVRFFITVLLIAPFFGCAAVGVMATSDPNQKLDDAYALYESGRALKARQIAEEALVIFEERKDQAKMAHAHSVLGDIYRDGGVGMQPDFATAETHFKKAIEIYRELKMPKWQAFILYALAGTQKLAKKPEACKTLAEAKQIYLHAPDATKPTESFERYKAFSLEDFPRIEKALGCTK